MKNKLRRGLARANAAGAKRAAEQMRRAYPGERPQLIEIAIRFLSLLAEDVEALLGENCDQNQTKGETKCLKLDDYRNQ